MAPRNIAHTRGGRRQQFQHPDGVVQVPLPNRSRVPSGWVTWRNSTSHSQPSSKYHCPHEAGGTRRFNFNAGRQPRLCRCPHEAGGTRHLASAPDCGRASATGQPRQAAHDAAASAPVGCPASATAHTRRAALGAAASAPVGCRASATAHTRAGGTTRSSFISSRLPR
jgi:hypothetical protein